MQNKSDAQLLGEYAAQGSEPAFAEVVARHTDLVYSAALRQTGSPELAREIAQGVFTDLARKAPALTGTLSPDASLAGWLFRGTRFAGLKLFRDDHRRRTRERQFMEHLDPAPDTVLDWERIAPVLDEAMAELGDTDREAVLLRYFKNQDFRAVGFALGVSDAAAQKRVSRAVERLREFLAKRGVTVGASGLVVVISANAVQAAPVGLAGTLSTAAVLAGTTAANATFGTKLLQAIGPTRIKIVAIAVVAVLVVTLFVMQRRANQPLRANNTLPREQSPQNITLGEAGLDGGIGVQIAYILPRGALLIERVIPDSPAERAGLTPGFCIQEIDGIATRELKQSGCVALLRGAVGTKVRLGIWDAEKKTNLTLELTRQKLVL